VSQEQLSASAAKDGSKSRDLVGDVGKILALLAILLPVVGAATRLTYLSWYTSAPVELAASEPPAELALIGGRIVALPLIFVVFTFLYVRVWYWVAPKLMNRARERLQSGPPLSVERMFLWPGSVRPSLTLAFVGGGCVAGSAALALFAPEWPYSAIAALEALLMSAVLIDIIARTGRLELTKVWPLIVLVLTASVIGAVFVGSGLGIYRARIEYASSLGSPRSGNVEVVGEDGSVYDLIECDVSKRPLVLVPENEIRSIRLEPTLISNPSLLDIAVLGSGFTVPEHRIC
jgi:hypothetical protein